MCKLGVISQERLKIDVKLLLSANRKLQKLKAGTYKFFTEAQTVTEKAEFTYNILTAGMQT